MKFVDLVNIKQGTDSVNRFSSGNTLPLVCLPHALNMFAPQTSSCRRAWFYHPSDRCFEGVRLTHQASPWVGDFSYLCFLPQINKLEVDPICRQSGFRPENVVLKPHLMEYYLLRYKTLLRLTPTDTGAIMTIDSSKHSGNPLFSIIPSDFKTQIDVDAKNRVVTGYTCSYSFAPYRDDFKMYFALHFDCDILSSESASVSERASAVGVRLSEKKYTVRVATSFISIDQAKYNLERELLNKTFDEIALDAEQKWENLLSRIQIDADEKIKRTFYSCMYRAFVFPNKLHEIARDGKVYHTVPQTDEVKEGYSYTNNGFWDTYRTVYPLYSIVCPEVIDEILEGYLNIYDDTGVLPRWVTPSEMNLMPGTLIEAVFADAVCKNLLSEKNKQRAFKATVNNANFVSVGDKIARKCVNEYKTLGYVPYELCEYSVNETLDCAYGDFCISVLADACGDEKTSKEYLLRSKNYKNLFDKTYGFMRGRDINGNFRQEPFDEFDWGGDYTEGGAWQSSFAVPQDYEGLASLYGGKQGFLAKMDELFATEPIYTVNSYPLEIHEMTEMAAIDYGQCAISNQPCFHIPFMYAEFGEKEKSFDIIKKMIDELFTYEDKGFPGDEDNGTMAAWYIFAVLGFYPTCPGKCEFTVSGPIVKGAKLCLNGKEIDLLKNLDKSNKISYFELIK